MDIIHFTKYYACLIKICDELVRVLPQTKITSLTLPNNMSSESVQALIQVLPETKIRNIIMPTEES